MTYELITINFIMYLSICWCLQYWEWYSPCASWYPLEAVVCEHNGSHQVD